MVENGETVIIHEDVLFRAIRDYKPISSKQSQNCKIQKVRPYDRPQENTRLAYTPKIISIGPLHHGKTELQPMEDFKHKYLNDLLTGGGEGKSDELLGRFIAAARKMEEEVRGHYDLSDINTICSDDFVRMLVIDGCFLLEFLFRSNTEREWFRKSHDDDLGLHGPLINHDILLFENQIPFFVLQKFHLIAMNHEVHATSTMVRVAYRYLCYNKWKNHMSFPVYYHDEAIIKPDSVRNLLHLCHMMLFSENRRPPFLDRKRIHRECTMDSFPSLFVNIISKLMYLIYIIFGDVFRITYPAPFLTSATEIEEAGVRFQGSPMELMFDEGILTIPVLTLNQQSSRLLKNLMIFEFYFQSLVTPYVNTYVSCLSELIKNPGDLKVMEKHHIIRTSAGGDESFELVGDLLQAGFENDVALKFQEQSPLGWPSGVDIHRDLWNYCEKRRHRWWAKLMKEYFGNPWSILGVLVGVILLVLTIIQTVFTVKSYYHQ